MSTTNYPPIGGTELPPIPLFEEPPAQTVDHENPVSAAAPQPQTRSDSSHLRTLARGIRHSWRLLEQTRSSNLANRWKAANLAIIQGCRAPLEPLADRSALLYEALREAKQALKTMAELPQIESQSELCAPRIYAAARSFLEAVHFDLQCEHLLLFFKALQEDFFFQDEELYALQPALQLALLEQLAEQVRELPTAKQVTETSNGDALQVPLRSLTTAAKVDWNTIFAELSETDHILTNDPGGAYAQMDVESRSRYHAAVAELARHSVWSEIEIAREAVKLAGEPHNVGDPRAMQRRLHVGFYLLDEGRKIIEARACYKATPADRIRATIRRWPTFFYLSAIGLITCGVLGAVCAGAGISPAVPARFALVFLVTLIPVTECAIAIANLIFTRIFTPERMPRIDLSAGIPDKCSTLVAIPILMTSEKQVRQAVRDLEIRYVGNRDKNLHFALVTDLPDSLYRFDKKDALAKVCSALIEELNEKYAGRGAGSFIHLHRHRAYNFAEKIWMGWERKRGKILDLNSLLLNQTDRFPVKAGNLSALTKIRYVITLDQDTQLLPDSARKLIGALAHPLNRAVIDPVTSRVVEGYAILQPRITISVKSTRRSRLAAIFSGDSYFDMYTRAVSDVYQDLFGAGIYTGKGIYEVSVFQKLLEHRFPCNAILSHDLIEGAHTRAGFISDIELVDDYPSHVSAYTRRKHRWVRGDWQIIVWLFPRVPESFGKLVPNPLSLISRWQILDNLRRSLSEVSTFVLLLCGWILWPREALFWTLAALALTAAPVLLDFFVSLAGAGRNLLNASFWRTVASDLGGKLGVLTCRIALLCHQSLIAIDAVVRTTVRMTVTHRRLLQWETAAQAELSSSDPVESYLTWTIPTSLIIAGAIARFFPSSLWIALPFLMLWGSSKAFCGWLSEPNPRFTRKLSARDQSALRYMALRTWRFFSEFCTEQENWLIPDVVQMEPPIVVHAASPTNLGFLLNAQLAACDLGFITSSRFVTTVERTIDSIGKLPTYDGHFYNWYDNLTLQPRGQGFLSTVDNGNFVCCLWTLKSACGELKTQPLFPKTLQPGIAVYLDALEAGLPTDCPDVALGPSIQELRRFAQLPVPGIAQDGWLKDLPAIANKVGVLESQIRACAPDSETAWWTSALSTHLRDIQEMIMDFAPWLSPEFADLHQLGRVLAGLPDASELTPETIFPVLQNLQDRLASHLEKEAVDDPDRALGNCLSQALARSAEISRRTLARLSSLEATAGRLADDQDFSLFYSPEKDLLSIGYDVEHEKLWDCHYDLLASEARAAMFVAIAKGDIRQKVWLRAGRSMAYIYGESGLLSWTGTMFEYLLPALWMKLFPDTLLERAARVAVLCQRNYAKERFIPWGISECSCGDMGTDGRFNYRAVGVPPLALSKVDADDLVVAPYATFLALMADGPAAAGNLLEMQARGWLGKYGFCDGYDFTVERLKNGNNCEVAACWMAHHQGMSIVAVANALNGNVMQRRFHGEPMVTAAERLLQEAMRNPPESLPEESSKLDWIKSSVPVLRNLWDSALASKGKESVASAADQDGQTGG
jgi:hypothetical protein